MDMGVTLSETKAVDVASAVVCSVEGSGSVPTKNPSHTPPRSVRVPNELWYAAQEVASDRGESVSEAVNRFLARYVKAGAVKDEDVLARTLRRLGA